MSSGRKESEHGPADGSEARGYGCLGHLRLDVIHQVAARAHRTEHRGIRNGRTLIAVHAAIHHRGETQGHEQLGMRKTLRAGYRPGQRHGQRERHGVGAPARARGERDDHREQLQQSGQQEVRNGVAELLHQESAAADFHATAQASGYGNATA